MKKLLLVTTLFALSTQVSYAATDPYGENENLIINGGFEAYAPSQTTHFAHVYHDGDTNKAVTGWDIGPAGLEIRANYVGQALEGTKFASLDTIPQPGRATSNSWISQSFQTTLGREYDLLFDYSASPQSTGRDTSGIDFYWGNNKIDGIVGTAAGGTPGANQNAWYYDWHYTVIGTGNIETLKFKATQLADTYGGDLDDIRLIAGPMPSAVPIPATAFLFASALIGLIGFRHKAKTTA